MKKNLNKIESGDIIRISNIYYQKTIDNSQSGSLSKEINSLRFSLDSLSGNLNYDTEAFSFSNTLQTLKK
ncbi:MAG: hypothetical protein CFH01_00643 [Alphaproteobacteria bacterium MarineAlpha2_Bin1]|nr:MAG: hypothetical protein CFH01_00643 [Alphaproteobacteria bacterium MarineAlpha2_Bin1]|tara:strand:- start:281 stop:490 length:210 start_codon:yes stop_codon:yes gene_type:complete